MKKTLSLIIIAIIALASSINASAQWTDRNTFNLKGPVKEVSDQFNGDFWSFYEDGEIIYEEDADLYWACIIRDDYGRITQISGIRYFYNNKGQVTGTAQRAIENEYTYNTKGQVIKVATINGWIEDCPTSITTYTYQKFDKYGNWTKRTAKTGKTRRVETRTITYYE